MTSDSAETAAPSPPVSGLSGTVVGHVVQARSIGGDVYIGAGPCRVVPPPRQLPRPPAHFTDRAGPVAEITRAAARDGPDCAIIVVSGPGGTGKTAVAVHALHQVADRYAGQLHASLGAFGATGPTRPEAVVAGWLRALGVHPAAVPGDPGEAAALFRSLTAGTRVAILADDAGSESQVRALLPAAGLVVVTSRYRLAGLAAADGARLVPLGPMDAAAAAELAVRITGRDAERTALTALAGCCSGLPLAVRAAAARLTARPALPAADVAAELAAARSLHAFDTPALETSVTDALDSSYRALDDGTARAYRLLATGPGPGFARPAAAALLDIDEPEAGQLAETLAAASLLEEDEPGCWHYHDMVREHARELAAQHDTEDERGAAIARVTSYYAQASADADRLILPGRLRSAPVFGLTAVNRPAFGSTAKALAWLDAERPSLLAAQQAAAGHGMHVLAWQFADTLWGWLRSRHDYQAWQQVCEIASASARACGDARAEVLADVRRAACLIAMGDTAAAATVAGAAIGTAWRNGDRAGEGSAREQAAICALNTGDIQAAISHCARGLECWKRISGHQRPQAIFLRLLGQAHARLGDDRQADEHLISALEIFTRGGERYHAARTRHIMADTLLASGPDSQHAAEAVSLLELARPVMVVEDQPLPLSQVLGSLALACARSGNTTRARACLDKATELQQELGLPASHPARTRTAQIAGQILPGQPAS